MPEKSLIGITVLDLTTRVAGPYCTKLLAMLGARVIKVEPPERGDISRWLGPFLGDEPHLERSALFAYLNTNKQGVTLDITQPAGVDLCRALAERCDAVVEDFAPGMLAKLGLDHAALARSHPALVMTSLTPFGQTGPYRYFPWSSLTLFALGGQMGLTGEPDRSPLSPYGYQAEYQLGLNGFAATLTALYGAQLSGLGQHVDVAGMEVQAATLEGSMPRTAYSGEVLKRRGNHGMALSGIYPCKDGYVGILAVARNWPAVVVLLDQPELLHDPRFRTAADRRANDDLLQTVLYRWFTEHTKAEIFERAGVTKAPVSPILTVADLFESPQLRSRGFFVQLHHPELGLQWYPGPPLNMSETPAELAPAPLLGQHNEAVFGELLGLGRQELTRLFAHRII